MEQYKNEYEQVKASGMMWEWFPDYSGNWDTDKYNFAEFKKNQLRVKEDMICPINKIHCDDECCTVGSICNISENEISDIKEPDFEFVEETPIARLRNLMSPICNYFYLKGLNKKDCKSEEEYNKLQELINENLQRCFNVLGEIKDLLHKDSNWTK